MFGGATVAKLKFTYDYPRPAVTVDAVLITREVKPRVLLIQRKHEPFAKSWALPGGFVNEGETLAQAARRELEEETALEVGELEQLVTVGDPGRDPRGWTVSVAFLGRVDSATAIAKAGDDAAEVRWFPLHKLPKLAFDHAAILERARIRLADRGC